MIRKEDGISKEIIGASIKYIVTLVQDYWNLLMKNVFVMNYRSKVLLFNGKMLLPWLIKE
jgi:hypothetical protein